MHRLVATVLGVVIALLAVVGLFVEGQHLLNLMNVDLTLDLLRVVLAAALLIVGLGRVPDGARRGVIVGVGALYVLMGILGFADPRLFGMLPTGLTGFDLGFHLIVGLAAIVLGLVPERSARTSARPAAQRA